MSMINKSTSKLRLGLVLAAGLFAAPAMADGLRVFADGANTLTPLALAGEFAFAVASHDGASFSDVRIVADKRHTVRCAAQTAQGRDFTLGSALRGGDRVECVGAPRARGGHSASIAVTGKDAAGKRQIRQASFIARPSAAADQGVVVLLAGGVHVDSNNNGLLDAGELINYHYSVVNAGSRALTALAVTDEFGAVSCPVTALALNAHTACTRSHVISAMEAADGMVMNQIDVTATDSAGDPVSAGDFMLSLDLAGNAGIRVFKSPFLQDDVDASGYASAGDLLRYTFLIKNSNQQTLTAVNLIEPDPTLIDTPITCAAQTLAGQAFTGLTTGSLQSNDVVLCQADHTITAAEAAAGIAHNLSEASGQPGFGSRVIGTGASAVVIPTAADVQIVKTLTGESGNLPLVAEPGETLTYTLTLSNAAGADALNYSVIDQLDPNTVFVSASNGGSHAGGSVVWSGLTVPAGGSLSLTVVVSVVDPIPAGALIVANLVYEAGTTPPPCPSADPRCVTIPTQGSVTLVKALASESGSLPGIAEPGEQLGYTITLTNVGGSAVSGYAVTDQLDANTSFVSASNGGTHAAGIVNWSNLSVPAESSLVLNVLVTVNDPLPATATRIANLAYETGTTPPPCPPAGSQCVIIPTVGNVVITKALTAESGIRPGLAEPGEQLTYTITLSNAAGTAVSGFAVSDALDVNTTFVSASNGGSHAAGVVNWNGLTVPAGGNVVLTVVVTVNDPIPLGVEQIANVAYETGSTPPVCGPGVAQCAIIPTDDPPQLSVSKTVDATTVVPYGTTVTYTVRVDNVGIVPASNVTISDALPTGISAFDWTCAAQNGATCPNASGSGALAEVVPVFPAGGSLTYTIAAVVADAAPAEILNVVMVSPPGAVQCVPGGTAPPCVAQAIVRAGSPLTTVAVPVDARWMQLLLALMLLGGAMVGLRQR